MRPTKSGLSRMTSTSTSPTQMHDSRNRLCLVPNERLNLFVQLSRRSVETGLSPVGPRLPRPYLCPLPFALCPLPYQQRQQRFLRVQPVLGLVEDDRVLRVHHVVCDFL